MDILFLLLRVNKYKEIFPIIKTIQNCIWIESVIDWSLLTYRALVDGVGQCGGCGIVAGGIGKNNLIKNIT